MEDCQLGVSDVLLDVKCCSVDVITNENEKQFLPMGFSKLPVIRSVTGIVIKTGHSVQRFRPGDEVAGILPLDMAKTLHGIHSTIVAEQFLVTKPSELAWEIAACCLLDGVTAYTALHYHAHIRPGDTLLICNGTDSTGVAMSQMAKHWGAKVLVTAPSEEEAQILRMMSNNSPQVFGGHQLLHNFVMDETGGLGVDCIIDNGLTRTDTSIYAADKDFSLPTKHDILSCLAVGGKWITRQNKLQIDPPDSEVLYMKGVSVCYLFPEIWTLSTFQQGRYLHLLKDVLNKAVTGVIRPHLMTVLPSSEVQSRSDLFPSQSCIVIKL